MTRNTQRRVEVACPIYDREARAKIHRILDACLADNTKARLLQPDGSYVPCPQGGTPVDSQQLMMDQAVHDQAQTAVKITPPRLSLLRRFKNPFSRKK